MVQHVCDRCRVVMPHDTKVARVHLETIIGENMPPLTERFDQHKSAMYNLELCPRCAEDLQEWVRPAVLLKAV